MNYGIVKVWNTAKGWGFIEGDDGEDYFFNIANIRKGQKISKGDNVKFDSIETMRGCEAENISRY